MTVRDLITAGTEQLSVARVPSETPYLDSVVLFAWASGLTKETVLASFPDRLTTLRPDTEERFHAACNRRGRGEPVAYIRGMREFYGLEFEVTPATLIPRPETEILVEEALRIIDNRDPGDIRVHDCCTGSGCIAVAVAVSVAESVRVSSVEVSFSDISEEALSVARRNSHTHLGRVLPNWRADLLEGEDLGQPRFDIVTANPPYLTSAETTECLSQGWGEPREALDGGSDGLDSIRRLVKQLPDRLSTEGRVLIELADNQYEAAAELMKDTGFSEIYPVNDLAGWRRVIVGTWYGSAENAGRS